MKLIFENDSELSYAVEESLNESTGKSEKKYKIKGHFTTIGEKNRNGRIYPSHLWEREIEKYQSELSSGSINCLMEWEHPPRVNVDPMEAVAKIDKLYISGKYVDGEAVLLDNPKANQLKSLIDAGVKLSVSSRGVGKVGHGGIVEDFKLTCYDLVATPSDLAATMSGMVESFRLNEGILEGKEFQINENGSIEEVQICTETACSMFKKEEVQDAIKTKFSGILESILLDPNPKNSKHKTKSRTCKAQFQYKNPVNQKMQKITLHFDSKESAETFADLNYMDMLSCN